ncbi:MAG: hypothetical protein LBO74_03935 [Candidatus Symbiothrix sp.]|jgi:hypothetical protein|nr:hypothetical protein [Candidatus Symbiothrix sp.]
MNITNEQAEYLLKLPKMVIIDDKILPHLTINQKFPLRERFELISETDNEFSFLWEIKQSAKSTFRISLHFQDNDSKIGLLRIDFNCGHTNPEGINEYLPEKFHPYVGKQLSINEHHIHYYVQGYKALAWAIPLTIDDFEIKTIEEKDFNTTLAKIITLFAKAINLETAITINALLL